MKEEQFDQENLEPANEITSLNKNETSKLAKLSFDSKLLKKNSNVEAGLLDT